MSSNFNINPTFNMKDFENSINDYNKVFSNSLNDSKQAISGANDFDKIFNSLSSNNQTPPIANSMQGFVGIDSINAQKIDSYSPVSKMAQDIGSGFSNSLKELNSIEKKAETDFETFASGGDISVHEVMISSQKSNTAMQMAIQLRNQMLNAYNEFKNMSV